MTNNLATLVKARDLLYMLTWRDIHVRYKQSVMGLLWSILMPSLIVGAGVLVRVGAAQFTGDPLKAEDISAVMIRAVPWSFFIAGVRFATGSLLVNSNLVTKIAFPKEVFPISAVFSNLFDFLIAGSVVVVIMLLTGWQPTLAALWFIPLMATLVLFTVGIALILSAANLFYRDVKYLVEVFLTYAIFFTPVLYPASMLGKWKDLLLLNPIAPLMEGISNAVVLGQAPELGWTVYSIAVTMVLLLAGYAMFKQLEGKFAESI